MIAFLQSHGKAVFKKKAFTGSLVALISGNKLINSVQSLLSSVTVEQEGFSIPLALVWDLLFQEREGNNPNTSSNHAWQ